VRLQLYVNWSLLFKELQNLPAQLLRAQKQGANLFDSESLENSCGIWLHLQMESLLRIQHLNKLDSVCNDVNGYKICVSDAQMVQRM
jgi:hypothetical protein